MRSSNGSVLLPIELSKSGARRDVSSLEYSTQPAHHASNAAPSRSRRHPKNASVHTGRQILKTFLSVGAGGGQYRREIITTCLRPVQRATGQQGKCDRHLPSATTVYQTLLIDTRYTARNLRFAGYDHFAFYRHTTIIKKCSTLSNPLHCLHLSPIPFRRSPCTWHQVVQISMKFA